MSEMKTIFVSEIEINRNRPVKMGRLSAKFMFYLINVRIISDDFGTLYIVLITDPITWINCRMYDPQIKDSVLFKNSGKLLKYGTDIRNIHEHLVAEHQIKLSVAIRQLFLEIRQMKGAFRIFLFRNF